MSKLIDENDIIKMLNTMDRYTSEELTLCDTDKTFPKNEVFIVDDVFEGLDALPSAQPEHTSNNDCNGCKFVGCYDTDFPCANCIRKNKDYYAPERRTDEADYRKE